MEICVNCYLICVSDLFVFLCSELEFDDLSFVNKCLTTCVWIGGNSYIKFWVHIINLRRCAESMNKMELLPNFNVIKYWFS